MKNDNVLLGDFLVKQCLITRDQLEEALNHQKQNQKLLGRSLVELGFIDENDIIKALGSQLGVQHVELKSIHVPFETIQVIPETVAKTYKLLPLYRTEETITVGMSNPLDLIAIDAVSRSTGLKVKPVVCMSEDIEEAIDYYYRSPNFDGHDDAHTVFNVPEETDFLNDPSTLFSEEEKVYRYSDEMSVSHLVHLFLVQSVHENASTIHLEPTESSLKIRFRINGDLKEYYNHSEKLRETIISTVKNLAYLDINRCDIPQIGSFYLRIDTKEIHFNVTSLPTVYGESIVLKVMRPHTMKTVKDLGVPANQYESFMDLINQTRGIVWFAGTIESGKTTSLYATLSELSGQNKDVVTFEREVYCPSDLFRQFQPTYQNETTPDKILEAIFRQDADVIAIDGFTSRIILDSVANMALKGQMIFSTLPSVTIAKALEFLAHQSNDPFLVADSSKGMMAQIMVKRICQNCKKEYKPTPAEVKRLTDVRLKSEIKFYAGSGCAECRGTGYNDRFPLFEFIMFDDTIRSLIIKKASSTRIQNYLQKIKYPNLFDEVLKKMSAGETTLHEALRVKQLVY